MTPLRLLLSSLLQALLLIHLHAPLTSSTYTHHKPTIFEALREIGCYKFADFLFKYPPPEIHFSNVTLFAPSDSAVDAFLAGSSSSSQTPYRLTRRQASRNTAANANSFGAGQAQSFSSQPAKGIVISSPAGGSTGGKVAKPAGAGGRRKARGVTINVDLDLITPDHDSDSQTCKIGTVTAGRGVKNNVLRDAFDYDKGRIFKVDSFLAIPEDFPTTISRFAKSEFNLTYLTQIFERIPDALGRLKRPPELTFLAPTYDAFTKTGLNPCTSSKEKLQAFLDDHTISKLKGFVGYTPSFEEGKCYVTDGGKGFVPRFEGADLWLGKAKVVGEDLIIVNGVVQVIDKVIGAVGYGKYERRTYRTSCDMDNY